MHTHSIDGRNGGVRGSWRNRQDVWSLVWQHKQTSALGMHLELDWPSHTLEWTSLSLPPPLPLSHSYTLITFSCTKKILQRMCEGQMRSKHFQNTHANAVLVGNLAETLILLRLIKTCAILLPKFQVCNNNNKEYLVLMMSMAKQIWQTLVKKSWGRGEGIALGM